MNLIKFLLILALVCVLALPFAEILNRIFPTPKHKDGRIEKIESGFIERRAYLLLRDKDTGTRVLFVDGALAVLPDAK